MGFSDYRRGRAGVDLEALTTLTADDILALSGGITVNEGAENVDFRVESQTNTHALFLDSSSSNVGMGTDDPDGNLHVMKASAGYVTASGDGNALVVEDDDVAGMTLLAPSNGIIFFGDAADNDIGRLIYQHSDDSMRFWTNNAERVRIDSDGKVGMGNTAPGSDLEISKVSGQASLELSSWSATATAAHAGAIKFQKSGTATVNTFTAGDHTTAGEILGRVEAYGVNDADASTLSSYIEFANDAVSDADSSPGKIVFATSDADDAGTPTVRLTIDDDGLATFTGKVSAAGGLAVTKGSAGAGSTTGSGGAAAVTQNGQRSGTFVITVSSGDSIAAQAACFVTVTCDQVDVTDAIICSIPGQSAGVMMSAAVTVISDGTSFLVMCKNESASTTIAAGSTFGVNWAIL